MRLILKNGVVFEGESFGASKSIAGEVVFNTGMVGYPEAFTDPSYAGQILVCTYPLVGNYGVPHKKAWESDKVQIAGLVVSEYSENYSHRTAKQSLADLLKKSRVPAITGVDTRALTKQLREHGVMPGVLTNSKEVAKFADPNKENLVARVSPKKKMVYGKGRFRLVVVDCGIKENIIRSLTRADTTIIRVPWDYDFTREKYDALILGNGPGDPTMCKATIEHVKKAMADGKPVLGICLGNQLLALAAGASTYKLKYGHRSQNQPCVETNTNRCYITSQNHGYAVNGKTLPVGWEEWFVNANDGSNEGIRHKSNKWRSVQFHPEAAPGPMDTMWIFDEFLEQIRV
ncbi:MAG: Carbamoyl-phosphate synthase small chain [Candidatus Kaiserbacteria bacterium GW2011_GWC2_49_12]|uniref:Carbamoyl phosphate synthase small chain n=4 Tax=Candidatus Kaiseribacteriota TaxID=1752734 RepID=A0A0G1WF47_9BACT|nr:MAG: Carbamoyl-phosphate synthase small chain [Candidatus Kaiserbacteria bacterium GW2011_GWC2_49_12]KKW17421.1 MAG: Carbamoyl-phosphate synthase small chain [Candidatus Kaiserbacteria bacterium GW2011_GWB1_50_17]KKW18081.1 MAG: Carbamoyl-phosphate synthase small chain [Candidatus Kaiserbacteria bacterium GW2011_GWA1_50_28]OGG88515.1 MAG: carbamoyl phosphate synthase small subunit [Candidatus Kaiserbacteria bacterium RIFCSPLOWO2_12_FULL_50_28]HCM43570.1 carbamoyl-phosphate synthase (glutamin